MLYRDLVQFDPIESVIQLRTADDKQAAAQLVQSYVISDRMADQLANLVFPQLQIDRPVDNKGVLVVGNYGTGKSHLMSLISALAEHADLVRLVRNPTVRDAAGTIAGRFKVVRAEIGAVERSFRDIVLDELERFLEQMGTPYTFPRADQLTNNKLSLIQVMSNFTERYPDMGVLFVLDELLDYLRSREERALFLDLGFLRELGEVTAATPFRFIAGVQETLFDNPRFAFVAEQLRRVRDRFEQVRIAREDIAYVVAERLLSKSDEQLARITEHLRRFTSLYPPMADRLGEFARLFPIHPAYIDTFERVYVAEKREVLQTFSKAIRSRLDDRVPTNQTGLISYDHYWNILKDNPSLRTLPGVAEVVSKSNVLEGRIQNAYTRKQLLDMAIRIIHALSVHRLTTSDIDAPLGVTAEELRDQLCLWAPLPEPDAEFLANTVQVALNEIMRTVSGQYISFNSDNGQYYLNLKKDIDFDAKIAERGGFMEERDLNRYFYDALQRLLNITASVHVTGFRIWPYELPWAAKNVTRPGYLFFGPPNERSTAQPPRDFYVYILPPFGSSTSKPRGEADEVIFDLQGLSSDFEDIVRKYAGAQAMAAESPNYRQTYEDKADTHLRSLMAWLRQNLNNHLRVSYHGITRTVPEVLAKTRSSASRDAEDLLRIISSHLLSQHFEDEYPEYPAFTRLAQPVSETARPASAMDAIRFLAGRVRTNLAIGVLDGLKLLDHEERIKPLNSPYACYFLDLLLARGETQVVNQGEIIEQVAGGVEPIFKEMHFKLEPEWVAVILLALVYDGQIVLNLGGNETLDAGNIERAAVKSIDDLTDFRFYRRPKTLPLPVWAKIFDAFGLQSSLVRDEATREQAVRALQEHVQRELNQVVDWQSKVQGGLTLWNTSLFTDRFSFTVQDSLVTGSDLPEITLSQTDLLPYLRKTKEFLEQISRFNTPGKLHNLPLTTRDADIALSDRAKALRIKDVLDVVNQLQQQTAYLSQAGAVLPSNHAWIAEAEQLREKLLTDIRRMAKSEGGIDLLAWRRQLDDLRRDYVRIYAELHNQYVLGPVEADRRARLLRDQRVEQLKTLSQVDILNDQELRRWGQDLNALPACRDFHPGLLEDSPICVSCNFRPIQSGSQATAVRRLETLEEQLDSIQRRWHAALHQNLQSETAQQSMRSMTAGERKPIDLYLAQRDPTAAPLPHGLVQAVNQALRGLKTIILDPNELLASLSEGGFPCTVEQLTQRFNDYVRGTMSGHDRRNTRLIIEQVQHTE
jgi:energy-coupling factor transporter ATP-binding protein EcfA2